MPRFEQVQPMRSQVNQSARWRMDSAISACPPRMVNHTQRCAEQGYACNPSHKLNQLLRSSIGSCSRLDVFASKLATDILRRLKCYIDTITNGSASQKIAYEPQIWKGTQNVSNLHDSLGVANIVLRQRP